MNQALSSVIDDLVEACPVARCIHCGASFTPVGFFTPACCSDECNDAVKALRGLDEHGNPVKATPVKTDTWQTVAKCPPKYARFDRAKLPARGKAVAGAVLAWKPGQTPGKGIALVGESDGGKSMLIHEAARLAFVDGWDVFCTLSTEFAWRVGQIDDGRLPYLDRCMSCALLLIDDIGKGKNTDRVEADLFHVLEHRERYDLPVIWSANSKGNQLAKNITEDRANPIVNRLRRLAVVHAV